MTSKCKHHPSLVCMECCDDGQEFIADELSVLRQQLAKASTIAAREHQLSDALYKALMHAFMCVDWDRNPDSLTMMVDVVEHAQSLYCSTRGRGNV